MEKYTVNKAPPKEISRKVINNNTVQSTYKEDSSHFVVQSIFDTNTDFADLLYCILQRKN